ncbi:CoiA-like domain protein (plasmid) [Rhizobium ruizarguesonis]|uniref:CoiA-like domain protein n=1 Tax=Rhizobium ruizarguesonis TaxID=2081791 RepID=A0ABY1X1G5_9HYPH|nr:CoiA-like domain protein [Rhizobium ruizarguesonis]TAU58407.1 CoiA-like domain protein [Rhizobium ruizarguesonis]TAV18909.1 CoiA-like domain protein [Rhizobium ruizarguesonis]TAV20055.1 CoiA-like domain protein [Rhizobium ruizarguesonis]TAW49305.1 CoiA-like domain protein [Rhizobium ruizarguesonis]TAW83981.1 CoiA-like domain protein [Rhizobium ruizarguesonis]
MQYALVDEVRREAFPNGKGTCPTCGSAMVAKCGPRILHHWAHAGRRNCDPWWENETVWHREWKERFPESCREISHMAPDGEIHRADIKTPTGIVIEVQHSSMTDAERLSRESFYGNLVWVIDGRGFRDNFDIYHLLPDPTSDLAQDLVWSKARRHMNGSNRGLFFRPSENQDHQPGATKATLKDGWVHGIHEIEDQVNTSYRGHHQYDWVRPRKTWLDATCPVYIDFGGDSLMRLEIYDETGLRCIRMIAKRKFVHDVMVETSARAIATRFYPLPRPESAHGQLDM